MKDPKNTFVLWSGGLDSTYMIQKLLEDDPTRHVHASYVEILNNPNKTKAEKRAIRRMEPFFNETYRGRFNFRGTSYTASVEHATGWIGLKQMPVWIGAIMSTTPDKADEICIGYVMNDCAISYLNELKALFRTYRGLCDGKFPKIEFPLSKMNKDMIVSNIHAELKQHVVWCENPRIDGENITPCGHCVSCEHSPLMAAKKSECCKEEFVEVFNKTPEMVQGKFDFVDAVIANVVDCPSPIYK